MRGSAGAKDEEEEEDEEEPGTSTSDRLVFHPRWPSQCKQST